MSLMLRRGMLLGLEKETPLPPGYTRIKYLEGSGSQQISSGWNLADVVTINMEIYFTSGEQTVFDNGAFFRYIFGSNTKGRVDFFGGGHGYAYWNISPITEDFRTVSIHYEWPPITGDWGIAYVLVDGTQYNGGCSKPSTTLEHIFLRGKQKIFSYQIIDGETIVRNFIPVIRDADQKPGLWDTKGSICPITNTPFYVNSAGNNAEFGYSTIDGSTIVQPVNPT